MRRRYIRLKTYILMINYRRFLSIQPLIDRSYFKVIWCKDLSKTRSCWRGEWWKKNAFSDWLAGSVSGWVKKDDHQKCVTLAFNNIVYLGIQFNFCFFYYSSSPAAETPEHSPLAVAPVHHRLSIRCGSGQCQCSAESLITQTLKGIIG